MANLWERRKNSGCFPAYRLSVCPNPCLSGCRTGWIAVVIGNVDFSGVSRRQTVSRGSGTDASHDKAASIRLAVAAPRSLDSDTKKVASSDRFCECVCGRRGGCLGIRSSRFRPLSRDVAAASDSARVHTCPKRNDPSALLSSFVLDSVRSTGSRSGLVGVVLPAKLADLELAAPWPHPSGCGSADNSVCLDD